MEITSIIETTAYVFTAIGVLLLLWQISLSNKQAVITFEDQVSNEYRRIIQNVPVDALLGKELEDAKLQQCMNKLYNYIDFTNEQIFLRQEKRIRKTTWSNWSQGIESNLKLPAFKKVWGIVKENLPDSFNELRKFENENFRSDPAGWE